MMQSISQTNFMNILIKDTFRLISLKENSFIEFDTAGSSR